MRLYKEPEPAGDSLWLALIQERRLPTRLLISHIRHATRGARTLANTQPLARELGGRTHVFAHNGRLKASTIGLPLRRTVFGRSATPILKGFCLLLDPVAPVG